MGIFKTGIKLLLKEMLPKIRQIGFNIMFFDDKNVQKGEITNNVLAAVL